MTYEDARQILLLHGSGTIDSAGNLSVAEDGFVGSLRPYRGLIERNFHLVMEALFSVADRLQQTPLIERELVESMWSMCSTSRGYGLHRDGMLQRNKLIAQADVLRLEVWISVIERTAQGILRGQAVHSHVHPYAQYVIDHVWWENIGFFIPLFVRAIEDDIEPMIPVAALGKLGPIALSSLPVLQRALTREYSYYIPVERCTEEVRATIRDAIRNIES